MTPASAARADTNDTPKPQPQRTVAPPLTAPVEVEVPDSGTPSSVRGARAFLIGMGGCGMSGLTRLLEARGAAVRGTDTTRSPFAESLIDEGYTLDIGEPPERLPDDVDLVVASAAVKPEHPLLLDADARGVEHLAYAEALGRLMDDSTGVAIAGTHGKSTTTAMLGCVLAHAGLDPSVIIGATCPDLGGGFRLGSPSVPSGTFVGRPGLLLAEACEYNRSFHNYRPTVGAIMSVEADHLDVYGSLDGVIDAFRTFAHQVAPAEEGGLLLIAHDGAHRNTVGAGASAKVQTVGFSPEADWQVVHDPGERRTGLVRRGQGLVGAWRTPLPGAHNALNAGFAAALAISLGADPDKVAEGLTDFGGVLRRTQRLGTRNGVSVWDDYGHHPTEVDTTLRALREHEGLGAPLRERPAEERDAPRLICVFQPHQHSRTRFLLEQFAEAFGSADVVIVPHIYFVRDSETERTRVSAADLVDRLRSRSIRAMHLYPFDAIVEQLENVCRPGDTLVVMGAGPVDTVARGFLHA